MSVSLKPLGPLCFADIFDGRLQKLGVYERVVEGKSSDRHRSLTDGRNSLWVNGNPDPDICEIEVFGTNNPDRILDAITQTFAVKFASEFQAEYWGFGTEEEWETSRKLQRNDEIYRQLLKHLLGQSSEIGILPSDIPLLSVNLIKAHIAQSLIIQNPTVLTPERKQDLIKMVQSEVSKLYAILNHNEPDDEYVHHYDMSRRHQEDAHEGPLPLGGFIYQTNHLRQVVAVEQPDCRAAKNSQNGRRPDMDDEIPF